MANKVCKYGCGKELVWNNDAHKFFETNGEEHSQERCKYVKSLLPKQNTPPPSVAPTTTSPAQQKFNDSELLAELKGIRKALESLAVIADQTRQHTEIIAQGETKRSSFKAASVTMKTDPQAELKEEFPDEEEIVQ